MSEKPLVIVPVTQHPVANTDQPNILTDIYTITLVHSEITFQNGMKDGRAGHPNNYEGVDESMESLFLGIDKLK